MFFPSHILNSELDHSWHLGSEHTGADCGQCPLNSLLHSGAYQLANSLHTVFHASCFQVSIYCLNGYCQPIYSFLLTSYSYYPNEKFKFSDSI